MNITFERIEDRPINYAQCHLITELGCDAIQGEYTLLLVGFLGTIDMTDTETGTDDICLIRDCIENELDFSKLPEEGVTELILEETGEWEDVFWHKYYKIARFAVLR